MEKHRGDGCEIVQRHGETARRAGTDAESRKRNSVADTSCRTESTGGTESVWQLCCLGEFLVISMIHLPSSEVVARCGLDFLCAGYFPWGLSRHMRVRFNAVVARANSAATFLSPR